MSEARRASAFRLLAAPLAATLVALAVLLSLGFWQLDRKAWKEELLRRIETRAHAAPTDIAAESTWPAWNASEDEYRRVRLAGRFESDKLVALNGLAELRERQATQGFYLFVPLKRPDGTTILVNRGFVPTELRAEAEAALKAAPPDGTVTGLVRAPETRSAFQPENEPAKESWWVRSVADMAKARGLGRVAPFYVDADATPNPGGWPRGGQTQLVLRNTHLQYAITWFGLAATLIAVFLAFARARLRQGRRPPKP